MSIVTRIILCFFGSAFIAMSYFQYVENNNLLSSSIITNGKVVDFKKMQRARVDKGIPKNNLLYFPIVEFVTEDGQNIEIKSKNASYPPIYKIGDLVEVRYEKDKPQNAILNNYSETWGFTTFLGVFGIILIIISFLPLKIQSK